MVTPLLTTKLYIPPVRPELVPRPRLIERLNAGLHRKLKLISAPAGFGKTSVMISRQQLLCGLVMLDASGNALACSLGGVGASTFWATQGFRPKPVCGGRRVLNLFLRVCEP